MERTYCSGKIPSSFVLPEEKRPHLSRISHLSSIPIIDLKDYNENRADSASLLVIEKTSQACQEYGFFQIINHGITEQICDRMVDSVAKLFETMSVEERNRFFTTDLTKQVKLFNYYINAGSDKVQLWSESFNHPWDPVNDLTHLLPQNPPGYK